MLLFPVSVTIAIYSEVPETGGGYLSFLLLSASLEGGGWGGVVFFSHRVVTSFFDRSVEKRGEGANLFLGRGAVGRCLLLARSTIAPMVLIFSTTALR